MRMRLILALVLLVGCTNGKSIPMEGSKIKWLSTVSEATSAFGTEKISIETNRSDPKEVSFIKRTLGNRFLGEIKLVSVAYDFAAKDEKYTQQLTWIEYQFADGFKKPTSVFTSALAEFGKPEFDLNRYSGQQILKANSKGIRPQEFNARITAWRLRDTTIQLIWDGDNSVYEYRLEMFYDPQATKLAELLEEKANFVAKGIALENSK